MNGELPIFLNPNAGSGNQREKLEELFRAAGARITITEARGGDLEHALRAALSRRVAVVGVAGGDGTLSAAANILAGTDTVLLPIPLGTFNHFAKRYGLASIEGAVHAWQRRSVHRTHVGSVNQRIFINNASCGFYPRAVRLRSRLETALPRVAAMWLAGMHVLIRLPLLEIELDAHGRQQHIRTPALWVGIGTNSLRLPTPGDAPGPGAVLEAVAGNAQTRLGALALAFRLFRHLKRGLQLRDRRLEVLRAPRLTLTASKPIDIALDGEPMTLRGPLTFAIRENALSIICLVAPAQ